MIAANGKRESVSRLTRLLESEKLLATALLAPGVIILALFIAYPFVMALWYSFTSMRVGDPGQFVGLANFTKAVNDTIFQQAFKNTVFYTFWATVFKLALGMWLALLLNRHFRFKRVVRATMLLPFIIPTVLSAFAWRWMFDPTFSVMNWALHHSGIITDRCRSCRTATGRCGARSRSTPGAACRFSPSPCSPACRPSAPTCTRRPPSTAPTPGAASRT